MIDGHTFSLSRRSILPELLACLFFALLIALGFIAWIALS